MMYDAEGRTTQAQKSVVGQSWTTQYKYDGDGRRVKKLDAAGATTVFVYDATGNLAAEYYSGSVTATKGVDYLTADHLGSTRMISNESGTIVTRRDYQPFGEEIPSSIGGRPGAYDTQTEIKQQFTGKERDAETGLDYFDFRYAASVLARFTSPDPEGFGSHIEDPQSWNRYVYARNNPLKYIDPLGLDYYEICGIDGKDCGRYSEKLYDKIRKDRNYIVAGAKLYARKKDGTQGELLGTVARIETGMGGLGDELTAGMAARAGASNQFIGTFAAASVAVGATGGAAANLLGLTSGSGLTTIGTIEVGTGTAQSGSAFTILNNQVPQKTIAELTRAAQKLYPNKANLLEQHHIFPKYLGGPANGPTAPLNVSV
jgi:RHS repeat-associated protein